MAHELVPSTRSHPRVLGREQKEILMKSPRPIGWTKSAFESHVAAMRIFRANALSLEAVAGETKLAPAMCRAAKFGEMLSDLG